MEIKELNLVRQLFKLYLEAWRQDKQLTDHKFSLGAEAYKMLKSSRFPNKSIDSKNRLRFLAKEVLLNPELDDYQLEFTAVESGLDESKIRPLIQSDENHPLDRRAKGQGC